MKSVLMRPPRIANSIRPRCVNPRLPPSPTTRERTWLPLMRTLSFVRSPASAFVSFECFTYVPIPPFHRRSTGAFRIARITSFGGISSGASSATPSAARASVDSVMLFALRSYTPPPADRVDVS